MSRGRGSSARRVRQRRHRRPQRAPPATGRGPRPRARRRRPCPTPTIRIPPRPLVDAASQRLAAAALGGLVTTAPRSEQPEKLVDNVEMAGAGAGEGRCVRQSAALRDGRADGAGASFGHGASDAAPGVEQAGRESFGLARRRCRGRTDPLVPANLITRGWADPQNHDVARQGGDYHSMNARRAARARPVL